MGYQTISIHIYIYFIYTIYNITFADASSLASVGTQSEVFVSTPGVLAWKSSAWSTAREIPSTMSGLHSNRALTLATGSKY